MKVYVAGPMTGYPEFNFPAFAEATAWLRGEGYSVFSPAERDLDQGFDPTGMTGHEDLAQHFFDLRGAMAEDLHWIASEAEMVAVLPGWEGSRGVTAEVVVAWALDISVRPLHLHPNAKLLGPPLMEPRS